MEFTLDENAAFDITGPVDLELPSYMKMLSPSDLREAQASATSESALILAVGCHPKSGNIVFLTSDGELREIKRKETDRQIVRVYPKDYGMTVRVEGYEEHAYEICCDWAIENSDLIINLMGQA